MASEQTLLNCTGGTLPWERDRVIGGRNLRARFRLILCAHDLSILPVATRADLNYWVPFNEFAEFFERVEANAAEAGIDIEITSDDGFVSDYEQLLPWLVERGVGATFFIPTAFVGREHRLTSHQLREMRMLGMRIGSHGHEHIDWALAQPDALRNDVRDGLSRLQDMLGEKVTAVAPPFGACNRHVLSVLREAGFEEVHLCRGGITRPTGLLRNRVALERRPRALERILRLSGGPTLWDQFHAALHMAQARFDTRRTWRT